MKKSILSKIIAAAFALALTAALPPHASGAATIVVQNNDAANTGFNDPTPAAPVGNNTGTTLGQQRLNAFQFAANLWGATLTSNVPITVRASWAPLGCTSTTATLGAASVVGIFRDFPNAPVGGTWYPSALANALRGVDLNSGSPEINAQFNSNLGNPGCLDGTRFYLGLDNEHGTDVDLVAVLLHEFAHGFGFVTLTNAGTGAQNSGFPSIYDHFLADNTTGKTWVQMTNAERQASALNTGNLVWTGARAGGDLRLVLGTPRLRVNAPASVAGNYAAGAASFGPRPTASGTGGGVVGASPADGCSALTNAAAVSGRLALVDRGGCNFVVKVRNAQDAGALGVIVVNNVSGALIQMGGSDTSLTIPALLVSLEDGALLRSQLDAGLNATLLFDNSVPSGVDAQGRPLLFAPSPFQAGSSVSHWDTSLTPNQLMEPGLAGDLIHSVAIPADLTGSQLRDVGWAFNPIGDANFFVRQHYLDFLSREPDASGLGFWRRDVFNCGIDLACAEVRRINVSAAFFQSIEFQETGYLVYRAYKAAYGDATSPGVPGTVPVVRLQEFQPDTQRIGQGVVVNQGEWRTRLEANKQAFALEFVERPRFLSAFPATLSAGEFVAKLDQNAGLVLTAEERAQLVSTLGMTPSDPSKRAAALRLVADHPALRRGELNRAFVLMQYYGYLRRNPDDAPEPGLNFGGWKFWLDKLNQFGGNFVEAEMVRAFIDSAEYIERFGGRP